MGRTGTFLGAHLGLPAPRASSRLVGAPWGGFKATLGILGGKGSLTLLRPGDPCWGPPSLCFQSANPAVPLVLALKCCLSWADGIPAFELDINHHLWVVCHFWAGFWEQGKDW